MQKKRFTRSSNQNNNKEFDEFKFSSQQAQKQQQTNKTQKNQKAEKFKPIQKKTKNDPLNPASIQLKKSPQNQNESQSISKDIREIKKKKVNKKEQNQGIRILQQKQTERIFQHLCNPDGLITVQSIGRLMVRAKKQFEIEDLQNMIAYYGTIKKKIESTKGEKDSEENKKKKVIGKQKDREVQIFSEMEDNQESEDNFEDDLDQSDHEQDSDFDEEEEKTELNFQEFKIIKEYFQR